MSKSIKKNKNKKKKTNRQKRSIKNRREAMKYIEYLNVAFDHITSKVSNNIFDSEDYLLLPYLKQGFKKGWRILKDSKVIKEIKCNSLCMTMSILNSTLATKKYDSLNPLQKLYLFFLSYLVKDNKLSKKEVTLKHAIHKIDIRIVNEEKKFKKYEKRGEQRNMKKCKKFIDKHETKKKQLIESEGKNKEGISGAFTLDLCNNIDCEYVHGYQMEKNEKFKSSYRKFCSYITELFKGIVWLNMNLIFTKQTNPLNIAKTNNELSLNINIRNMINKIDILLIPDRNMYKNDLFYDRSVSDGKYKEDTLNDNYWVYTGLDRKNKTIQKKSISMLEDKHYVIAYLSFYSPYDLSNEEKQNKRYELFNDFVHGRGDLPVLKSITKKIKKMGHRDIFDLGEVIDKSITVHWLYIHRDRLSDHIKYFID